MKYAIVYNTLAIGAKDGNRILKTGDPLTENCIDNFDKLVEKEAIKIITKAEYEKLRNVKTGQAKDEAPKIEAPKKEEAPKVEADPETEAIKETELFKETFKLNKPVIVEKLKEAGFIGEIDTELTKEVLAIQVVKAVQSNEAE